MRSASISARSGSAAWWARSRSKPLGETVQLRQMAVAEERQREASAAASLACRRLGPGAGYRLMVLNARLGAEGFYAAYGYHAEGEPFEENTVPHVRMTKRLG